MSDDRIAEWLPEIHGARERTGVTADQYPDAVMLAFLDIESDGDPEANRPGSQFHGLLQMGTAAGRDVGFEDGTEPLMGEDGDPESEDDFEAFFRLSERYADAHDYQPLRLATLWKGGVGTARTVAERMEAGIDFRRALIYAEQKHSIPRLVGYVNDFRRELAAWSQWVNEQNADHGICANEVLDV